MTASPKPIITAPTHNCATVRAPFKPCPGQYYFLYQLMALLGWGNHPFMLGSYTTKDVPATLNDSSSASSDSVAGTYNSRLVFYVRPYDGWTQRLRKKCQNSAAGTVIPKLLVDGPYGEKSALRQFETVLLFVGGTGIALLVPDILQHLQRKRSNQTRTTNIQLLWSGCQMDMFDDIATTDLREALQSNASTQPAEASPVLVASEKINEKSSASLPGATSCDSASSVQSPAYTTTYGCPDVKTIIAANV